MGHCKLKIDRWIAGGSVGEACRTGRIRVVSDCDPENQFTTHYSPKHA
jgi:hypothetical protein